MLLILIAPLPAADFASWFRDFRAAVARRDAAAIAKQAHFPLHWENGPIREIQSEADLVKNFDRYFTPEISKIIASKMPVGEPTGNFTITWKARGNEYSLYFKPEGQTFVLDGLSEGPA